MPRTDRIARAVVADLDESPRIDFWAAVLRTFSDDTLSVIADGLEDRSDDPVTVRVLRALENNFGKILDYYQRQYPDFGFDRFFFQNLQSNSPAAKDSKARNVVENNLGYFARELKEYIPGIVHAAIQADYIPIGNLRPGQRFFFDTLDDVWTVVSPGPNGQVNISAGSRYRSVDRSVHVFPVPD
jgi:hypothetical protein